MTPYHKQEEEEARTRRQLVKKAVDLAVQGRWEEAETVNGSIIEMFRGDVGAYNRLGRALTELRDYDRAREAYLKALELSPNNAIAKKNLERLANLPEPTPPPYGEHRKITPELFTTELGKSQIVNLEAMASDELIAQLGIGDQVRLVIKGQRLIIESESSKYLGELDPKHALRLIKLMEGGNKYTAAVLGIRKGEVQILIKEIYQDPSQAGYLSFPVKTKRRTYSHFKDSVLKQSLEDVEGIEDFEEEVTHSKDEVEPLPEGFSLVGGNNEVNDKGEFET